MAGCEAVISDRVFEWKGRLMSTTLSLERSEYTVVWLPADPSVEVTVPPPRNVKNDPSAGKRTVPEMRATVRFLLAMCIGVFATLTWQSYSKAAKQPAAGSSLPVGSAPVGEMTANAIVPAAFAVVPSPDQPELAALRQNIDQLALSQRQISLSFVQLASAQQQMMRDLAELQQADRPMVATAAVPLPRPARAEARKHAARLAAKATATGAGQGFHHAVTSSASTRASSPLPAQLTRIDAGHKRTQSSAPDRKSPASDPLGQSLTFAGRNLMSALSKITGIQL
jgi:hypothetical protein